MRISNEFARAHAVLQLLKCIWDAGKTIRYGLNIIRLRRALALGKYDTRTTNIL